MSAALRTCLTRDGNLYLCDPRPFLAIVLPEYFLAGLFWDVMTVSIQASITFIPFPFPIQEKGIEDDVRARFFSGMKRVLCRSDRFVELTSSLGWCRS